MSNTYLPADVRTRIIDLMKERKVTQKKLAQAINVHESTLGRFLNGTTEKLSEESVIRIARVFDVSTDFILGTTNIPDKKNYDISELGLSVEAAKNLYTGKVKSDVVNRLLESPRFATVTYMSAQYLDDTMAAGFAAHNQMIASLNSMVLGQVRTPTAVQAAREANACRIPHYQADLTNIQNTFMAAVKEVKKEYGSDIEAKKAQAQETIESLIASMTKGQDMQNPTINAQQFADSITGAVSGADCVDQNALNDFNKALVRLAEAMKAQNEKPAE